MRSRILNVILLSATLFVSSALFSQGPDPMPKLSADQLTLSTYGDLGGRP